MTLFEISVCLVVILYIIISNRSKHYVHQKYISTLKRVAPDEHEKTRLKEKSKKNRMFSSSELSYVNHALSGEYYKLNIPDLTKAGDSLCNVYAYDNLFFAVLGVAGLLGVIIYLVSVFIVM